MTLISVLFLDIICTGIHEAIYGMVAKWHYLMIQSGREFV